INGRGTMKESPAASGLANRTLAGDSSAVVVIDLSECTYLDSTFLGCLTGLYGRFGHAPSPRFFVAGSPEKRKALLGAVKIDSAVMMGEPMGEMPPMPASIYLYETDCDAVYDRAMQAGGTSYMPPTTMHFSGQRYGGVKDPAGNLWWIATNVEDVSPEESKRR